MMITGQAPSVIRVVCAMSLAVSMVHFSSFVNGHGAAPTHLEFIVDE